MKRLLPVLAALLLASCVSMTRVGPGEVVIRERLVAQLDGSWNRLDAPGQGKTEMWTRDGFPLDVLRFIVGVEDGQPLLEGGNAKAKEVPKFRAAMRPEEIVETFDAVVSQGGNRFHLDRLAPADFAGGAGFRFDFTLVRKSDEVELKGFGYGVVRDKRLYLLTFQAPKIYYFKRNAEGAESVARSVRFKG